MKPNGVKLLKLKQIGGLSKKLQKFDFLALGAFWR